MLRATMTLGALVLLPGCVTLQDEQPQLNAYFTCNFRASHKVHDQEGRPAELAIAAHSYCRNEETALRVAVDAGRSSVAASRLMALYKRSVIEDNIGWIVQFRQGRTR